ncbi:MAG: hypothetical protein ABSG75_02740 [Syntrophales bacterium]|jgi:hypothetical protein
MTLGVLNFAGFEVRGEVAFPLHPEVNNRMEIIDLKQQNRRDGVLE